jgi:hypothetical protein
MMRFRFLSAGLALMLMGAGGAWAQPSPEALLKAAIQVDAAQHERSGSPEAAIEAYASAGLIGLDADTRADYTSYYLVRKHTEFFGHTLVVIEHEYMDEYVGCCVSPGVGLTVRVKGSTDALQKFAADNGCSFADNTDPAAELRQYGLKSMLFKAHYASLSCRERDLGLDVDEEEPEPDQAGE